MPVVLAGPVVRRVLPSSVTVWMTLRVPANVTLKVFDTSGAQHFEGRSPTIALSAYMHTLTVTATPLANCADLSDTSIYLYDVIIDCIDVRNGTGLSLADAAQNAMRDDACEPSARLRFSLVRKDVNAATMLQATVCRANDNAANARGGRSWL